MAAGSSDRFGSNKLLAKLKDKPVLAYSLEAFERSDLVKSVIVVTSENIIDDVSKIIDNYKLVKVKNTVLGGKTRQDSVRNALSFIKENNFDCSYVVIHDGARPLINFTDIDNCVQSAIKYKATTLAVKPKDTIKMADCSSMRTIISTLPRELLWAVQTPQAFLFNLVYKAHMTALKDNFVSTDDCALVERAGIKPIIIESNYRNLKITTPEDLIIADVLM